MFVYKYGSILETGEKKTNGLFDLFFSLAYFDMVGDVSIKVRLTWYFENETNCCCQGQR